jgi:16S rRNA C967 or C1407 C5-methylase (RsmB/RsmF family)
MAFNPNVEIDYARYDTDERSQHSMHSTGGPKRYAGQSQETAFTQRMSQILDVKPRRIPEIFSNHPYKTVRANPLKIEGDDYDSYVAEMLSDAEIDADPLGWIEGAYVFDVENTAHVQSLKSVQCGAAFIQNPSSYLPVLALDVQPGQKILDMCSAPGGKASFIGALTDNRAELMVNEPKAAACSGSVMYLKQLAFQRNTQMQMENIYPTYSRDANLIQ